MNPAHRRPPIASVPPQAVAGQRSNRRAYYHLYAAQTLALVSTGIAAVALALLAGGDAGAVLGTALAIKMGTCVVITYPLAGWRGATAGLAVAFAALGLVATAAAVVAMRLWPRHDPATAHAAYPMPDHGILRPSGSK